MRSIYLTLVLLAFCMHAQSALACTPLIEVHASNTSATFRPHSNALEPCTVDEATYQRITSTWIRTLSHDNKRITSLMLGRAIQYPWLSQHIADAALGEAQRYHGDRLAAAVLRDPVLLQRLAIPFAGSQYELISVSYEKVLFGPAYKHATKPNAGARSIPFDAQLWLILKPRLEP